jgi:5-formyltetrahydrofolate cyclo-ligase
MVMCSSILEAKRKLRQEMGSLRDSVPAEARREKSRRIFSSLQSLPVYRRAGLILFYFSFGSEVETREMILKSQTLGKRIALPKVMEDSGNLVAFEVSDLDQDLGLGYRGILEPRKERGRQIREDDLGLILVPGLAFDRRGYRLGYGKGYYDRFLSGLSRGIPSIGLAFDFQVIEALPVSSEDFSLDLIITEQRMIRGEKGLLPLCQEEVSERESASDSRGGEGNCM